MQVDTKNVDGFTITGQGNGTARVTIDGAVLRTRNGVPLSFRKSASGWEQGLAAAGGKRAGAEGPIVRAVSGRHIYVYGSLGAPTVEEIDQRRRVAQAAASWSTVRSRLALTLPVKMDREVTPEEMEGADLVLFGTAASNSLIARYAAQLPLELRPDAADHELLFIAPVGKHYVLVNSGLPWWTGAEEGRVGGYPWAPTQYRMLSGFEDYVLFRGSVTQVVAGGRFDGNWRTPAGAAARMAATGTVKIRQ